MEHKAIKFKPFNHQKMIIDHITSRDRSAVFAGMGLGKSVSTLKAIYELFFRGKCKGVLIVAPLRVTNLTWPMECQKWSFSRCFKLCNLRYALSAKKTKKAEKSRRRARQMWDEGSANIYLINYEMLPKLIDELIAGRERIPCNMIVFDELSCAKNPSSKRINQLRKFIKHFDLRVGLTGTPLPNGYLDLFAQIRLLDDGEALDYRITKYKSDYFYNPDGQGFNWVLRAGAREMIEDKISHLTITLSSEDYLDIPEVEYKDHDIKLPTEARRQYKKLEKEFLIELQGGDVPAISAAALTNKLLQLSSGAVYDEDGITRILHDEKIKKLQKLVAEIDDTVIIACAYKHEQQRILNALPQAEMFQESRLHAWNNKEIPVWVTDYRSISHGLNLQAGGSNIIWFTPTYSFESYDQFNARLARTGQEHRTTIHRLIAVDTMDEAVVEALRQKKEGQSGLMEALKVLEMMNTI